MSLADAIRKNRVSIENEDGDSLSKNQIISITSSLIDEVKKFKDNPKTRQMKIACIQRLGEARNLISKLD